MDIKFFQSFDTTHSYNILLHNHFTMCKETGKSNSFKGNFKVKNCEQNQKNPKKPWADISIFDTGIPHFSKVHVTPLHFYKRSTKRNLKKIVAFTEKRQKVKTAQNLFCSKHSKQQEWDLQAPSPGPILSNSASSHPSSKLCEHLGYILTLCIH